MYRQIDHSGSGFHRADCAADPLGGKYVFGMGRREFITLLGGAAVTWPLVARAQQSAMPVIGWLSVASADGMLARLSDFREGLKQQGFVEHQNVLIEYRWANEQSELLQRLAVELISRRVSVIAVGGGTV